MIAFAKFAGEVWDQIFSAGSQNGASKGEAAAVLDARIKHWLDTVLPTIPLLPPSGAPTQRHLRQHILVTTVRSRSSLQNRILTPVS